jgi:hypothetical protein
MSVCIELRSNSASKTFIKLSSGACNLVEIGSPLFHFVDPTIDLRSRECILFLMIPETGNNLDSEHIIVRGEFNGVALFDFDIVDILSRIELLLPAKFPCP